MKKATIIALLAVATLFTINSCLKHSAVPVPVVTPTPTTGFCDTITYAKHLQPIIQNNCGLGGGSCHGGGSMQGDFNTYTGVKAKVDNGTIRKRVLIDKDMPPGGGMSQADLDIIKCWLDAGALNN